MGAAEQFLRDQLAAQEAITEGMYAVRREIIEAGHRAEREMADQQAVIDDLRRALEYIGPKPVEEIVSPPTTDFQRAYGSSTSGLEARGLRGD